MQMSAMVPSMDARKRVAAREIIDPVACAEVSRLLMDLARRVAASECTVLIAGE